MAERRAARGLHRLRDPELRRAARPDGVVMLPTAGDGVGARAGYT